MNIKWLCLVLIIGFNACDSNTMEQKETQKEESSLVCNVCENVLKDQDSFYMLDCKHVFCSACYNDIARLGIACVICNAKKAQRANYKECCCCGNIIIMKRD